MNISIRKLALHVILLLTVTAILGSSVQAQGLSSGTVTGTVLDPNNAAVPNANVTIANPVTGYKRTVTSGADGTFRFDNVPPNSYQLSVSASGFNAATKSLDVRSNVPLNINVPLTVGGTSVSVTVSTVSATDVLENEPSSHVDVDTSLLNKLPARDSGSGLSTAVTLAAPGVAADSNGGYHPLGDHFESNLSLDNQPISDQSSKLFSTQIPVNIIQSMEVITGATPPEYGDKTSLVVNAITRTGLNQKKPTGSVNALYGSFGTVHTDSALAYGNARAGNFVAFNFDRSGRFLDSPEFRPLHDRGTATNIFDRIDYSPNQKDTFHLNLFVARNQFQTPNQFDQQAIGQG